MNSRNDSALSESLEIGDHDAHDSLANRERLGVAYKALHSNAPRALDLFAALNVAIQDEFAGRTKGICLAAGMSEKQYQHIVKGLNGDGYPAVILAVLWEAAPQSMARVIGRVFAPMGYTAPTEVRHHGLPCDCPECLARPW